MRLLTVDDLCEKLQVSRMQLYRLRKSVNVCFPDPIMLRSSMRWREEHIREWLDYLAERCEAKKVGRDPDLVATPVYGARLRETVPPSSEE